jgi:hypothetical protein
VPAPPLQAGKEYTFAVHHESPGKLTEEPFYEWDFGDGSGIEIPFSNEATHAFAKEGKYTIRVTLFESDEEAAPLLGVATAEVIVEGQAVSTISYIQQTTHLLVAVRGGTTEHYSSGESRDGSRVLIIYLAAASTTWSDNHFTNKYFIIPTDSSSGIDLTIEGDVSDECDKIFNLTATIIYDDSHSLAGEQRESRIYLTNVPLEPKSPIPTTHDPNYKAHFVAYIEGVDVADYVTNTFYEHHQPQTNDPNYKIWYDPLKFENIEPIPYLLIVFKTYRIDAHDDPGYQKRD